MSICDLLRYIILNKRPQPIGDFIKKSAKSIQYTYPMKPGGLFWVSRIPYLCPREEVICSIHRITRKQTIYANTELGFSVGEAMHQVIQSRLLGKHGALLGSWICMECGNIYDGPQPMPEKCKCGKRRNFVFREMRVKDEELGVKGKYDGLLQLPDGDEYQFSKESILEIKTCNAWRFHSAKIAPFPNDVIQLQTYMFLTECKSGVLVYWNAEERTLSKAMSEHWIECDEKIVKEVKEKLRTLKEGVETGTLPARICSARDEKRALACPVTKGCWDDACNGAGSESHC